MNMNQTIVRKVTKSVSGILLAISSSEENGCIGVKMALCTDSNWSYSNIVDINMPEEYLYAMAAEAGKDVFELVGAPIEVRLTVSNQTITNIEEITVQ